MLLKPDLRHKSRSFGRVNIYPPLFVWSASVLRLFKNPSKRSRVTFELPLVTRMSHAGLKFSPARSTAFPRLLAILNRPDLIQDGSQSNVVIIELGICRTLA